MSAAGAASVSARVPDWRRETPRRRWDPARRLVRTLRDHAAVAGGPFARLRRRAIAVRHRAWSVVTGADLPLGTRIGGGLVLPHPSGVVIHPEVVIGPNCTIFQQVTLGTTRGRPGVPVLGGHVDIGPGARVLGPVRIGDHAVVGANAVVLRNVPAGATAVGVPARILPGASAPEAISENRT